MNEEANKAKKASPWKTKQGANLLQAMLYKKELTPGDQALLQELRKTSKLAPKAQPKEGRAMEAAEAMVDRGDLDSKMPSKEAVDVVAKILAKEAMKKAQAQKPKPKDCAMEAMEPREDRDDLETRTHQWLKEREHLSPDKLIQALVSDHKMRVARNKRFQSRGMMVSFRPSIPHWPYLPETLQVQALQALEKS